jgi:heme/copper-type cytochrome/quinol oxidase subunit 2
LRWGDPLHRVAHSLSVPKPKIDVPIPKSGELVVVDFIAPPPGRFDIACSEYCGNGHGRMKASLISVAAPATSRQDTR